MQHRMLNLEYIYTSIYVWCGMLPLDNAYCIRYNIDLTKYIVQFVGSPFHNAKDTVQKVESVIYSSHHIVQCP